MHKDWWTILQLLADLNNSPKSSEQINNEMEKEIDLKNIFQGIYFVKIFSGEKQHTEKIVIQ